MGVVKGIDPKTAMAAHAYINLFNDADFQKTFAIKRGVVPENLLSLKGLEENATLKRLMILDPDDIAKMLHTDYSKVNVSDWHDQWNRTVSK